MGPVAALRGLATEWSVQHRRFVQIAKHKTVRKTTPVEQLIMKCEELLAFVCLTHSEWKTFDLDRCKALRNLCTVYAHAQSQHKHIPPSCL